MKKLNIALACIISAASVSALCACSGKDNVKKYTVDFDTHGGNEISSQRVAAGSKISRPKDPQKDMFKFDDWYYEVKNDGKTTMIKFDFSSKMPAYDMTLHALWIGETSVRIDYDANGGVFADGQEHFDIGLAGSAFDEPEARPERDGYIFGGWYTEPECSNPFDFYNYPIESATLYAGWEKDPEYAYISYYGNGELLTVDHVKLGSDIKVPQLFDGEYSEDLIVGDWYTDPGFRNKYVFGKATGDIDLYAAYYTDGLVITGGVVTQYTGSSDKVIIPSVYENRTVTAIGEYAFYKADSSAAVVSVKLPDTVKTIGDGAFYDCRYLSVIEFTDTVTEIGNNAFFNNARLRELGDISSVMSIGDGAFIGCKQLMSVELPETLTSLGEYAFSDCEALKEIVIPSGVNAVSANAFDGCKLLTAVTLKSGSLASVGSDAFKDCTSLLSVTIERSDGAAAVAATAFSNCYNAVIYVPADLLETYRNNAANDALKKKFAAIR